LNVTGDARVKKIRFNKSGTVDVVVLDKPANRNPKPKKKRKNAGRKKTRAAKRKPNHKCKATKNRRRNGRPPQSSDKYEVYSQTKKRLRKTLPKWNLMMRVDKGPWHKESGPYGAVSKQAAERGFESAVHYKQSRKVLKDLGMEYKVVRASK